MLETEAGNRNVHIVHLYFATNSLWFWVKQFVHHHELIVRDEAVSTVIKETWINRSHWDQMVHAEFCIYETSAQCCLPPPLVVYWEGENLL